MTETKPPGVEMPYRLARLPELAYNLLWTWRPGIRALFAQLDPELWESTEHNPVRLLRETGRLEEVSRDNSFLDAYDRAVAELDGYLEERDTWTAENHPELLDAGPVAYFSAEFGLHECLPIYSGGLGVLAGDHVKSASDLGLPFVGVGLLYSQGYFRQRINADGRQEEAYESFAPATRPVSPARNAGGEEVFVEVPLPGRMLRLKVWEVLVGRARLLLLDADRPENAPGDREFTARLYGGDGRTRIVQEMILGVGGFRALRSLGLDPVVYHMNEGHAAFSGLERLRELAANGVSFGEAVRQVSQNTVFTTHTPVPAGHDAFPPELFWEFLGGWPEELGTDGDGLWRLGHKEEEWGPTFNMTVLAIRLSAARNAVSALHGEVSREMWSYLFEDGEESITHVTNGIHTWSWLSPTMEALFVRHAGEKNGWRARPEEPGSWSFVHDIPDGELWEAHGAVRREAIGFLNDRLRLQAERSGGEFRPMDPDALTIGFARRFATYKRATLLLQDPERLKRILSGEGRPVQFVFAGKAHPADEPAKAFIRALHEAAEGDLAGHLFVLEDYDMNVARHLVQGVDVWHNNPRRPLEASGTSGQKASLNGAPNFSVLDGWWPEAYNGKNGWAIGEELEYASQKEQDTADVESLYEKLDNEIVPLYYDSDTSGWVGVMKEAIVTVAPEFSTQRMVQDYVGELYTPRLTEKAR